MFSVRKSTSLSRNFAVSYRQLNTFGFVFDIDGVLLRRRTALPKAKETLHWLHRNKRPFIFLTNGGGKLESERANELSELFSLPITGHQVILAHTPMKELVEKYHDKPIILIGEGGVSRVAEDYGFKKAMEIGDYWRSWPELLADPKIVNMLPPSSKGKQLFDPKEERVQAIFSLSDSMFWKQDIQVLFDLLVTNGRPADKKFSEQQIPFYCSNGDFVYPDVFHHPRFAQGAFLECLNALYHRSTGKHINFTFYGKPTKLSFEFAQKRLQEQLPHSAFKNISTIYMVGDNPQVDVKGANNIGHPWKSVLVKTGVFSGESENDQHNPAHFVVDDVGHALELAKRHHSVE
eukprot:c17637_g1_i1.p1 GENE.c17637_g1_i1~~c17637_g1_i1.p1  ORF type:complete len:356 (-),score=138.97 c17637_g1_i1:23-1066(-)